MTRRGCARLWELDAYQEGRLDAHEATSFERHLRTCRECSEQRASDRRLRDLARRLKAPPSDALALRRTRRRILSDAAAGPSAGNVFWRWAAAVGMAVAVVGGAFAWSARGLHARTARGLTAATEAGVSAARPSPVPSFAGTVTSVPGARFSQTRDGAFEHVDLDDGTIEVQVRAQRVGERFIVTLPDGVVEVRGTAFEIAVRDGRTVRVLVREGVVELRLDGRPVERLEAGASWASPSPDASAPLASSSLPVPRHLDSPAPPRAAAEIDDDGSSAYSDAMRLFRAGHDEQAAAALHAFVVAHPGASQAEDASFLEAVALARAGRLDAAALAAERHLASFPASFHRKEATLLVERAARLRGAVRDAPAVQGVASASGIISP